MFNMTGGEISNNEGEMGGGISFGLGGPFTISGGVIKNNTSNFGGGVMLSGGELIMSGGEISGNIAKLEGGGGVGIQSYGTFNMSAGEIKNNTADNGGGVLVGWNSTFNMTGGTVSGNTAEKLGGGVYTLPAGEGYARAGVFNKSGSAVVSGNSPEDSGSTPPATSTNPPTPTIPTEPPETSTTPEETTTVPTETKTEPPETKPEPPDEDDQGEDDDNQGNFTSKEVADSLNIKSGTTDNPVKIDGVSLPDNHIVISSSIHGELGFDYPIEITLEQIHSAGLDSGNLKLFYIDDDGKIIEIHNAVTVNADGSVTVTISHFSNYVLSEVAPISGEIPIPPEVIEDSGKSNTGLIIGIIIAVIVIGGGVTAVVIIKKKRKES